MSTVTIVKTQKAGPLEILKKAPQVLGEKAKTFLTNPVCNAWNVSQAAGGGLIALGVGGLVLPTVILAAAGSIVPGAGTAIGAVIGGSVGVAICATLITLGVGIWAASTLASTTQDIIMHSKRGDSLGGHAKNFLLQSMKNLAWSCGFGVLGAGLTAGFVASCACPLIGAATTFGVLSTAVTVGSFAYSIYSQIEKAVRQDAKVLEKKVLEEKIEEVSKQHKKQKHTSLTSRSVENPNQGEVIEKLKEQLENQQRRIEEIENLLKKNSR